MSRDEHPFMRGDDDSNDYQPLSTATELVLAWGPRSTPLTICFHSSHERAPERDATVLATMLQTSLDFETFKMTSLLMFQMLQMRMQQQNSQMDQFAQLFKVDVQPEIDLDDIPEEPNGPEDPEEPPDSHPFR